MHERKPAPDAPAVSAAELAKLPPGEYRYLAVERPDRGRGVAARGVDRTTLLGRTAMPHDPQDHRMRDHLTAAQISDAQLDMTLRQLLAGGFFSNWKQVLAFWRWARPKKPKPTQRRAKLWEDTQQLDQGQTGHCVGFCWAQWHNTLPVGGIWVNADGHAVYYECKVIDGEPHAEDGSNTRSGAKAMQNRGRLGEYVFAQTVEELIAWVLHKGPFSTGTDWDGPMFTPDANGYLHPDGNAEGGHEWLIVGYDDGQPNDYADTEPYFVMQNSWGLGWGVQVTQGTDRLYTTHTPGGRAKITVREYKQLFARDGDAAAGLELEVK